MRALKQNANKQRTAITHKYTWPPRAHHVTQIIRRLRIGASSAIVASRVFPSQRTLRCATAATAKRKCLAAFNDFAGVAACTTSTTSAWATRSSRPFCSSSSCTQISQYANVHAQKLRERRVSKRCSTNMRRPRRRRSRMSAYEWHTKTLHRLQHTRSAETSRCKLQVVYACECNSRRSFVVYVLLQVRSITAHHTKHKNTVSMPCTITCIITQARAAYKADGIARMFAVRSTYSG